MERLIAEKTRTHEMRRNKKESNTKERENGAKKESSSNSKL
jgi:hypothetical protein